MPRVPRNRPANTRNTPSRRAWRLLIKACKVQAGTSVAASRQPVIDFVSLPLIFCPSGLDRGPRSGGLRLVKRQDNDSLLWGLIVEPRPIPRTITLVMVTAAVHRKTKPCSVSQGGFCVCQRCHSPVCKTSPDVKQNMQDLVFGGRTRFPC